MRRWSDRCRPRRSRSVGGREATSLQGPRRTNEVTRSLARAQNTFQPFQVMKFGDWTTGWERSDLTCYPSLLVLRVRAGARANASTVTRTESSVLVQKSDYREGKKRLPEIFDSDSKRRVGRRAGAGGTHNTTLARAGCLQ